LRAVPSRHCWAACATHISAWGKWWRQENGRWRIAHFCSVVLDVVGGGTRRGEGQPRPAPPHHHIPRPPALHAARHSRMRLPPAARIARARCLPPSPPRRALHRSGHHALHYAWRVALLVGERTTTLTTTSIVPLPAVLDLPSAHTRALLYGNARFPHPPHIARTAHPRVLASRSAGCITSSTRAGDILQPAFFFIGSADGITTGLKHRFHTRRHREGGVAATAFCGLTWTLAAILQFDHYRRTTPTATRYTTPT